MHDVVVLYNHPDSPEAFDAHYRDVHTSLVNALPKLREFSWGKTSNDDAGYYLVARLTYDCADDAADSLGSNAGQRSVEDLANFAGAGVTVLNVTRDATVLSQTREA
jgi:uncharacterized protein (TIGR02118 family)